MADATDPDANDLETLPLGIDWTSRLRVLPDRGRTYGYGPPNILQRFWIVPAIPLAAYVVASLGGDDIAVIGWPILLVIFYIWSQREVARDVHRAMWGAVDRLRSENADLRSALTHVLIHGDDDCHECESAKRIAGG